MNHKPLAVFDLDGTLIDADSLLPFLVGYARHCGRTWPLIRLPIDLGLYAAGMVRDQVTKERLLRLFCGGRELEPIREYARTFFDRWLPKHWRRNVVERLEEHQRNGQRVIVVSASPDLYVPLIAESLKVSEVVCTRVGQRDGLCLGSIVGTNCKGEAKVAMLLDYLGHELPPGSFAYGDSKSDLPLLTAVESGYLCDRRGRLTPVLRRS